MFTENPKRHVVKPADIKAGMMATEYIMTDRYAHVVAKVLSPKKLLLTPYDERDCGERIIDEAGVEWASPDNFLAHYDENVEKIGRKYGVHGLHNNMNFMKELGTVVTLRKNGRWVPKGYPQKYCVCYAIGYGWEYRDPEF